MALTSAQQNDLFKLTVGLFNAAPGSFYTEVEGILVGSQTPAAAAQVLINTAAFQAILPSNILTNTQFSTKFLDMLVGSTVSDANKAWAVAQMDAKLNAGETQGAVAWWAIDELSKVPTSNTDWGNASATLLNKVSVAQYFTVDKYVASNSIATLQGLLVDVTSDVASVAVAKANATSNAIALTTTVGETVGTSGADTFQAFLANGANTLQSGDTVRGGAGSDTLMADVNDLGGENAVAFSSQSVEKVMLRAQHAGTTNNGGDNNLGAAKVAIDAERAAGVNTWEDYNSRADLIVEDVRIASNQITKDITIIMRETDPGHVDYGVYFDQNSLRNVSSATSQINLQVMDTRAVVDGKAPLLNSPYGGFRFTSTNAATGLSTVVTLQSQAIDDAQTYADLRAAFQAAVDAQFGAGVVTAAIGSSFTVTDTTTGAGVTGSEIVLSTSGAFTFTTPTGSGWIANGVVPANSGLHTNFSTGGATSVALVTSTIVLDDVGRGSTGGDLVVGGLSVGDTSTSKGVQRFEITVEDNSKLQHISSTNNTLREVSIVNGTTTRMTDAYTTTVTNAGNLTVNGQIPNNTDTALPGTLVDQDRDGTADAGENQHGAYGFSDVRLIDGSAMNGQLAFTAEVTSASIAKYLNLADTANNPASDNVAFVYSGGNNNDTIVVDIDSSIAASTNTLSGREDFTFTINGGAGNDTITTDFVGVGSAAWIADQKQNANATIDGGAGNDTIWTKGDGAVIINAGTGDDTVYADNTGTIGAKWAVNDGAPAILTDLFTNGATKGFLYNGKLTVAFSGAGGTGLGGGVTAGTADSTAANFTNGFEVVVNIPTGTNYEVTQLHLNQAIKAAINGDAVLNKLLTATDGPANTLVISSKIDGTFNANDLKMSVTSTDVTTLASSEQATVLAAFKTYAHDSAAVIATAQTANAASVTAFNAVSGMDVNQVLGATTGSTINVVTAVTTQGVTAVAEVQTLTFTGTTRTDGNISVGGVTVAVLAADTAAQTATKVAAALNGQALTAPNTGVNTVAAAAVGDVVTVTFAGAAAAADVAAVAVANGTSTITGAVAVAETTKGVAQVAEIFTATFSGVATAAETLTFDTTASAAFAGGETGAAIAAAMTGAGGGTWGVGVVAGSTVTFTANAAGAVADVTAAAFTSSVATVNANGAISTAESDNTINMAAGSDVLVMGTGANSNDVLVFTGYDNGKETVVNFEDTVVASRDMVDFRSYLTGKSSASGSVDSQLPIAVTANTNASVEANSVTAINGAFTTTDTFAGLTAAKLLAAINSTNTGTASYAGITAATLDAVTTYNATNTLVGGIGHGVVLVQNNLNEGEYAVFDVTFNGVAASNATADFSAATLIGVVDFGNTVDFSTANVLVGF